MSLQDCCNKPRWARADEQRKNRQPTMIGSHTPVATTAAKRPWGWHGESAMQRSNLIDHKSSLVLALILISMAACSQPPAAGTAAAPAAAAPPTPAAPAPAAGACSSSAVGGAPSPAAAGGGAASGGDRLCAAVACCICTLARVATSAQGAGRTVRYARHALARSWDGLAGAPALCRP